MFKLIMYVIMIINHYIYDSYILYGVRIRLIGWHCHEWSVDICCIDNYLVKKFMIK